MFFLILLAALGLWVAFLVTLAVTSPGGDESSRATALGFFTRI